MGTKATYDIFQENILSCPALYLTQIYQNILFVSQFNKSTHNILILSWIKKNIVSCDFLRISHFKISKYTI